jgi:hypothetical protein
LVLVTVRVPEQLRKEMRKLKSVNWSELLRDAMKSRIELEHRTTTRDWEKIREGSSKADKVYKEMERKYGQINFNSAETIRYWREIRSRDMSRTPR